MNPQSVSRITFIEMLNEAFLSYTGYGAYAYLTTIGGVNLFDQFIEQPQPAQIFIKSFVKDFVP